MEDRQYKTVTWEEYNNLLKKHFDINPRKVDEYSIKANGEYLNPTWYSKEDWESMEDVELLMLLEGLKPFEGELLVVTDSCLVRESGPVSISSDNLKSFVENHLKDFGVCFFNTDVKIVNLKLKLMWIFHHEGVYALIDRNNDE